MSDTLLSTPEPAPQQQQQQNPNPTPQAGEGQSFNFRSVIADDGNFSADWTKSLPDSHKAYAATLQKFPSPLALASSYGELEKKLSERSKPLAPPLPGDPPEKVNAYRAELRKLTGAPDKPEGYDIKAPEKMPDGMTWDEQGAKELSEILHKHGAPKDLAADLIALNQKMGAAMIDKTKAGIAEYVESQKKILTDEWKGDTTKNIGIAKNAADVLDVDINNPEVANNAELIKVLYKAGLMMREDKMLGSVSGSVKSLETQKAELMASDAFNGKLGDAAQKDALDRLKMLSGHK